MDVNLVYFNPKGDQKSVKLDKDITLIGRGTDCDLRVPVDMCSRQHCQVEIRQAGVICRDLGSANGTLVNNERINEVTLSPGDKITIGPIVFILQVDGEPASVAPVETAVAPPTPPMSNDEELIPAEPDFEDADEDDALAAISLDDDDDEDPLAALEALAGEDEDEEDDPLG